MNSPIRVVVIDDNEKFRSIIRDILRDCRDIDVCGEAHTLETARAILKKLRPDVAIVDVSIDQPDGGLHFLKEIGKDRFSTRYIVLSAHDEDSYSAKARKAGGHGYLCKDKTVTKLAQAIRTVHDGNEFVSA